MCYDFSYFAVVYTLASAAQHFFTVIIFDSENIPSLSVEVVVSVSYDVLLIQSLYITAGPLRGLWGPRAIAKSGVHSIDCVRGVWGMPPENV